MTELRRSAIPPYLHPIAEDEDEAAAVVVRGWAAEATGTDGAVYGQLVIMGEDAYQRMGALEALAEHGYRAAEMAVVAEMKRLGVWEGEIPAHLDGFGG